MQEAHVEELAVSQESPSASLATRLVRILFCAVLPLLLLGCEKKEEKAAPQPPEVLVTEVTQRNVPVVQEYVALLNGPVNADITPKVQGYLLRQNYQNGFFVRKGQLLFELDPRQYQAALDEVKAQVAVAEANLARVTADVERDTPLAAQNAIPQKQLDNDQANQRSMLAAVKAAKAAQQNAELNVSWTKIYSPIDGIAGTASSQIGDLVGTTTKMATVSKVNPIWADFNVSEASFLSIAPDVTGYITGRTSLAKLKNVAEYIQANDEPYPHRGNIVAVNRSVGTATGTIQVTAEFPNTESALRPGGFGRVRISTGNNKGALLVPQAAVVEVQTDYQLIVVTPESKAIFRPVKVGDRVGTNWIITQGVKPGERVVVEGIQKVQQFAAAAPELMKSGGVPVVAKQWAPATTQAAAGSN